MRALVSFPLVLAALAALAACGPKSAGPAEPDPTTGGGDVAGGEPTPAPPPADPEPKTDGDITEAWLSGMHVLIKRIPGAESATTQLYALGGVRNWGEPDAGVEQLAVATAVRGGTEALDRDAFSRKLEELGSAIGGETSDDYSAFTAWSLTATWEETFGLVVDTFRRPAMPATQLELERTRVLAALKREQEDPDARLQLLLRDTLFAGHPYQHRAIGTPTSVAGLTLAQCKAQLGKLRETTRLLLVVVGDIEPSKVIDVARAKLADLPRGKYLDAPMPMWNVPAAGKVVVVDDKLPTNYITSVVPGPSWNDPDFAVAWVAMSTLSSREFEEVRSKRNLSYAPSAGFARQMRLPWAMLYVTAVDPKTTMQVMFEQAKRMRDEPVPAAELTGIKSTLLTRTLTAAETPADQAAQLALAQIFGDDWRLSRTLAERARAVTAEQVQAWSAKRLTKFQTFVIGDRSKLDIPALEEF
jgi:zinc protease